MGKLKRIGGCLNFHLNEIILSLQVKAKLGKPTMFRAMQMLRKSFMHGLLGL
jgi:hypothetical protein